MSPPAGDSRPLSAAREAGTPEFARLVEHLRRAADAPDLDLADPPAALSGGYDTQIYVLRLRRAPPAFAGPLVLRVLRPHHDPARVLREQATHDTLVAHGYPAPRVLLAVTDPGVVGAPFLLMERLAGVPLLNAAVLSMHRVLADLQLRLHALDATPLRRALGETATFGGYLVGLERRIDAAALDGLAPLVGWLREQRPAPGPPPAICHGDFHPQNVLVHDGRVTGVLDWPNVVLADPAFDVASTLNVLTFVPAALLSVPRPLQWLASGGRRWLAARYLARYRRRCPIDDRRLAYYRVAAALRALVRAGEVRRRGSASISALDASPYAARLLGYAAGVAGRPATLP